MLAFDSNIDALLGQALRLISELPPALRSFYRVTDAALRLQLHETAELKASQERCEVFPYAALRRHSSRYRQG